MADVIRVSDRGRELAFSFEEMLRYNGRRSAGGVAIAFKALERATGLLDAVPDRRAIAVATAFGGPGARDAFELVARAVSDGRYRIDPALARPALGPVRARFVFHVAAGERGTVLVLRDGFVTEEFLALANAEARTGEEDRRLDALKDDLATRVMGATAAEVFDAEAGGPARAPRDRLATARATYEAYATGDRGALEEALAEDFTFSSPADVGLDRAGYFARCWPNAGRLAAFAFTRLAEIGGDEVLVTYEATRTDGTRFRNTEVLTFAGDRVARAEVYFGWELG